MSVTPYEHLKKICSLKPAPAKLFIVCPDSVRRSRSLDFAIKSLCPSGQSMAIQKYEASSLNSESLRELKDSSMSLSLFSPQTFIVIKNIDQAQSSTAKELEQLLNSKNSSNTFICSASSVSSRTTAAKAFSKDETVEFPKLEGEEVLKWISQELKRQGFPDAASNVVRVIAGMGSDDLDQIAALIEKLSLYCDGQKISISDIEALDTYKEKVQEFNFVNMIATGKKTGALAYIEQLQSNDSSAFPLIGLLSKMFSNYLRLKIGKSSKRSDPEIQKDLGLSPWALKKQLEIAQGCEEAKLIRAIKSITRADSQLKNKNLGESSVLTELVSNVS